MGRKKERKLKQEKTFTGVVDHVKRRYCFVSSDEITDDIKIKSRDMKNAINGDKVLFKLLNNYNYKSFEGAIIKVIERSKNEFQLVTLTRTFILLSYFFLLFFLMKKSVNIFLLSGIKKAKSL